MTRPHTSAALIDPQALLRIASLELRARTVVQGFISGRHRSPYHGFSVEFSEYRPYTGGDDPRYLDWRLLARTDRYYLKRFEDETNLRCYLLVDRSRSMEYGGPAPAAGRASGANTDRARQVAKRDYASTLAATLAYFLTLQRDAVGLITFHQRIEEYVPARYRPGHLRRLLLSLERTPQGRLTDLGAPLEEVARTVKKRGLVVLLSDLLAPASALEKPLSALVARGHEVVILRLLDPGEQEPNWDAAAVFCDLETGREMYVDPRAAGAVYRRNFEAHRETLNLIAARLGIDLVTLTTDQPLELALADFLRARQRRGRPTLRARSAGGCR
jgi:uncharacterized protein (DUF58 family)